MKNSASNPSITQALREHATQLLPILSTTLTQWGYFKCSHQRISQQNNDDSIVYQGLTRAQNQQFGSVMIKWSLSSKNKSNSSDLGHEIEVLKTSNNSMQLQRNAPSVPAVLAHNTVNFPIGNQSSQLIILVMPYYPLGSLAHQLNHKNSQLLTDRHKQRFIEQAANLIANLHKQGWLHNDIKPSNILLNNFGSINTEEQTAIPSLLLTDFALAMRIDEVSDFNQERVANSAGTPAYLAPECWQGQGVTQQSDIYAFGIMIYEILIGTRPLKISKQSNDSTLDWATQHCQQPMPALPKQYQRYQFIINKALAKRVEKRYQSMSDILKELQLLKNS